MSHNEKDRETNQDRNFLSRWSQRKSNAKQPDDDGAAAHADHKVKASRAIVESHAADEFDLSSLPKLEDVTEATDITGFLRKGVPESLRNAALQKSWALDPAIRNYINPALDYAYDWNTPGGVPGTSEIAVGTDIAKMVLQIMGSDPSNQSVEPDADAKTSLHLSNMSDPPDNLIKAVAIPYSRSNPSDQQVLLSNEENFQTSLPESFETTKCFELENIDDSDNNFRSELSAMQQPAQRHGSARPKFR